MSEKTKSIREGVSGPQGEQVWHGIFPIVQLPWDSDENIDYPVLKREIDWLLSEGCHGLAVGMVTEAHRLTDVERDQLNEKLVEYAANRVPVVASVGAESSRQACRHTRAAESAGASGVMAIPPALTRCSPEELLNYYTRILDATSLPVIVQDASGYLGNPIPLETQARIFEIDPSRVMFKPEAQPIGQNLSRLRALVGPAAIIFEGTGGLTLVDTYRRGIQGSMPAADLPWVHVALWKALESGDTERTNAFHALLCSLISLMPTLDAFLCIEKYLLVKQGIFPTGQLRGPVGFKLDDPLRQEVDRLFDLLHTAVYETWKI